MDSHEHTTVLFHSNDAEFVLIGYGVHVDHMR